MPPSKNGPASSAESEADAALHSDQSLLRLLRGGSQDAATQLYLRYANRLRALAKTQFSAELARREELDDVVQSVFGSFFRGATRGQYDVPEGEDLWKLLLVIALNKIRAKGKYHRAAMRDVRVTRGVEDIEEAEAPRSRRDDSALENLNAVIHESLQRLPPTQQRMTMMRIQGYTVAEIAAATERAYRSVERGLKVFRDMLEERLKEEDY